MRRKRVSLMENLMRSGMLLKTSMPLYAKVTFINVVTLLCMTVFAAFAAANYLRGSETFAIFEIALSIGFAVSFFLLRITARIAPSAIVDSLLLYVGTAVLLITGGTEGTGIYWLLICPLLFLSFWGRKLGSVWVIGQIVIILTLAALDSMDVLAVSYDLFEVIIFSIAMSLFSVLLWMHNYLNQLTLRTIDDE